MFFKSIRFRTNVAMVLLEVFQYDFGKMQPLQKKFFNPFCSDVLKRGGSKYNAASQFMAIMADAVTDAFEHAEMIVRWANTASTLAMQGVLNETPRAVNEMRDRDIDKYGVL